MCDENNQLPGATPVFSQTSGTAFSTSGMYRCGGCNTWVTGFHSCPGTYYAGYVQVAPATTWAQPERKPHVCPVCEGNGVNDKGLAPGSKCPACKGECVLWG